MQRMIAAGFVAVLSAGAVSLLEAQGRGGGEWTTSHGDAQRTSWVRTDVRLTKDAVAKGEFKFLWRMKLANENRQLNSLTQPILLDRLISHRGFKALAFVGASAERVYAIDTDLSRPYWETVINYSSIDPPANSSWACPGGLMATVTRPTGYAVSAFAGGRGAGRGGQSGSSVGEPGRGAPSLQQVGRGRGTGDPAPAGRGVNPAAPPAPGTPAAQAGRGAGRGAGGGGGLGGGPTENVYVLGSDGFVRALNTHNGAERYPMVEFLPGNARASALIFVDGVLYTTTSNECGAVPNGVYAIDLNQEKKQTISWLTGGPSVAGSAGPTFGTDGTLYIAVAEGPRTATTAGQDYASSIVALDAGTLKVKDWFSAPKADFNASPVVFRYKDKDLVLATANDGRLYVLDSASLGGADHTTPLHVTGKYTAGATAGVATWEDQNTRWVLAPAVGAPPVDVKPTAATRPSPAAAADLPSTPAIPPELGVPSLPAVQAPRATRTGRVVAFKLVDQDGKLSLVSAWSSREMVSPLTPVIFNGVLFAASSGEYRAAPDAKVTAAQRAQRSVPAVLYALDPLTGKELWGSAKTITSFARGGLSAAAGQVYLVTYDNTLYAFGIPMEH